jgi:phosphoglucosamine mutase
VHFGTDGLRGRAGTEITESVAYRLGCAVAEVFPGQTCCIGADTRESSPSLAAAVAAGLVAHGSAAVNLGVLPTPAVAAVAGARGTVAVVVSASHNPFSDNGLKVLGGAAKLDVATEQAVQDAFDAARGHDGPFAPVPIDHTGADAYLVARRGVVGERGLAGLHLVLDCANGAASVVAPALFRSVGAQVAVINASPDGTNINRNCGSTHPEALAAAVLAEHADLGLAFDGDADRLIAVDNHGRVRDGDDLMVVFALDLAERGALGPAIAVTHLSNLGLHRAMREAQIGVIETDIGDRAVLAALEEHGLNFGGEQSGHLIFRDRLSTGDGLLTGLLLSDLVKRRGRLSSLADAAWHRVPQQLVSVPKGAYDAAFVSDTCARLVDAHGVAVRDYRLLVRPSGTEPVIRVMIESVDGPFVEAFVAELTRRFPVVS